MKLEFTPKLSVGQCAWMIDPDTLQLRVVKVVTVNARFETAAPVVSYQVRVFDEEGSPYKAEPVFERYLAATIEDAMEYLSVSLTEIGFHQDIRVP